MIREAVQNVGDRRGVWGVTHESVAGALPVKTSTSTVRHYYPRARQLRALYDDKKNKR